jgi:hypothetical protein
VAQAHILRRGRWTLHDLLRGLDILSGGGARDGGQGVGKRQRLIAISLSRRSSAEVVAGVHAWASRALPGTCRFSLVRRSGMVAGASDARGTFAGCALQATW